jgi:hypothetical protein
MAIKSQKVSTSDLVWAEDVMSVYRLGNGVLPTNASDSLRSLYRWCQNPENNDKLMTQLVLKATDILSKHRAPEEQGAVVVAEKKGIAELQEFLRQHIELSQAGRTNDPTRYAHTWANRQKPAVTHPSFQSGFPHKDQAGGPEVGGGDQHGTSEQSGAGSPGGV